MDILQKFNPANAASLTKEDIAEMRNLTAQQIAELATAYPNTPTGNAYLHYYNSKEKESEQKYPLGTWHNLNSLLKLGRTEFSAVGFRKGFVAPVAKAAASTPARVVDISKSDVANAEGLKKDDMDYQSKLSAIKELNARPVDETLTIEKATVMVNFFTDEYGALEITSETNELRRELIHTIESLNSYINKKSAIPPVIDEGAISNIVNTDTTKEAKEENVINANDPKVIAYKEAVTELNGLKDDRAHHMTIKSQEQKVADLKEAAGL